MPYPRLDDDGHTATLDLHGASVEEALALAERLVREAARRGRSNVKLVHGQSTSSRLYQNRTIKHDLLDRGTLDDVVVYAWRAEGHLLLALDVTASSDPTPIRLRDIL